MVRALELERLGLRGQALRLALWVEGYQVADHRLRRDLLAVAAGFQSVQKLRGRLAGDLAADELVIRMVRSHEPNPAVSLALAKIGNRHDVEAAFLNVFQLLFGTPPSALELDGQSAKPLAQVIELIGGSDGVDPFALSEMIASDEGFARYCQEFLRLPEWSLEDWTLGRDDALALSQAGVLPAVSPLLRGGLFLGARLSFVMGAVAQRRVDPRGWGVWIRGACEGENQPRSA